MTVPLDTWPCSGNAQWPSFPSLLRGLVVVVRSNGQLYSKLQLLDFIYEEHERSGVKGKSGNTKWFAACHISDAVTRIEKNSGKVMLYAWFTGIRRYALGLRVWHFLLGMTAGIISKTGTSSHELLCIIGLYFVSSYNPYFTAIFRVRYSHLSERRVRCTVIGCLPCL